MSRAKAELEQMTALPERADADLDREHGPILSPVPSFEAADQSGIELLVKPLQKRFVRVWVEPQVLAR